MSENTTTKYGYLYIIFGIICIIVLHWLMILCGFNPLTLGLLFVIPGASIIYGGILGTFAQMGLRKGYSRMDTRFEVILVIVSILIVALLPLLEYDYDMLIWVIARSITFA